ncbi:MAG: hypothetical protein ABEK50_17755 [bacterium]
MKIAPDYMREYLDTERTIFLILLLACLGLGYYLYQLHQRRNELQEASATFASNAPRYQKLRRKLLQSRPQVPDELKESPLAFMEKVIPQEYLTNLNPTDSGDQKGYQFKLQLKSKDIKDILSLVSTLEEEPLLEITEFRLIRKSLDSPKFHSVMQLRTIQ